jgi:hypothetical protein
MNVHYTISLYMFNICYNLFTAEHQDLGAVIVGEEPHSINLIPGLYSRESDAY